MGFLALDGILLFLAGLWSGVTGLFIWGGLFGMVAVAVVFSWRRYQRQITELNEALRLRELEFLAIQHEFDQQRNGSAN